MQRRPELSPAVPSAPGASSNAPRPRGRARELPSCRGRPRGGPKRAVRAALKAGAAPAPPEARWLRPARVPGQGHGVVRSHRRPRRGRQRDTGGSTGLASLSVPPYPAPGTPCGSVRARPRVGGLGLLGSARPAAGGVPRAGNGLSLPLSPTLPLHLPLVPGSAGGGAGCAARGGGLRRTAPHITAPPVGRPPRGAPREERGAGAAPPGNGEGSRGAPASPPPPVPPLPAAAYPPPLLSPLPGGRRGGSADSWAAVPGERRRSGAAARRDSASPPEREDEEEEKEGGGEGGGGSGRQG